MTTDNETKIEGALMDRVESLVWDAAQIAWPNIKFTPKIGTKFLRPTVIPGETLSPGVSPDSSEDHQGLLDVSLFYPAGSGALSPQRDASIILDHFAKDINMVRQDVVVTVSKAPWRETAIQETDWYHVPRRIPYRALVVPS